jgi:two-component system, chemotaxis family, chemotaxis protein CheY
MTSEEIGKTMAQIDYSKLHILVVEDERFTRDLTCALLRAIGVGSVTACEDGQAGLLELLRTRPDLVFCDVRMARLDGLGFLKKVRSAKVQGVDRTPIIFLTGDAAADTVLFAQTHEANGYLVKPVSLAQIRDRIDAVIAADGVLRERAVVAP